MTSNASAEPARIGLLYPTRDCGEDDFTRLAHLVDPAVAVGVGYVRWGDSVSNVADLHALEKMDAVRELGEPDRLQCGVDELDAFAPQVLTWACTSCSFLWGYEGANRQVDELARRSGLPASSTSLAFVAATRAFSATRVSVASVYGEEITAAFIDFLAAAGITTVHHVAHNAPSDRVLARWDRNQILNLVAAADSERAEAVVVPETALHTADLLAELEERAGKPVLTATQVTIWHALTQLGWNEPRRGLGALFDRNSS